MSRLNPGIVRRHHPESEANTLVSLGYTDDHTPKLSTIATTPSPCAASTATLTTPPAPSTSSSASSSFMKEPVCRPLKRCAAGLFQDRHPSVSSRWRQRGNRVSGHGAVDGVGKAAFEAAQCFLVTLPGCAFALVVGISVLPTWTCRLGPNGC